MNKLTVAIVFIAAMALPATANAAAACRDSKGHFVKCPAPAPAATHAAPRPTAHPAVAAHPAATTTRRAPCRDAKGRFKKC